MIIIGMTGPIGHGKSTFANTLKELEPSTQHFESFYIVAEVANALQSATRQLPKRDDIDSINDWLRPLPSILLSTVHQKCTFEQIALTAKEDINLHPIEYEKLFLHIQNLNSQPDLVKQEINKENKEQYRPLLQWLGGYLVEKIDPGIWYKEIIRRVHAVSSSTRLCIIGGLRYPTDAQYVHQAGGVIVKVYRPGHLQYDMRDPTERERENIKPDTTIVSNGTVDDLKACARQVVNDITADKLQKTYHAAP